MALLRVTPSVEQKLETLGTAARHDLSCSCAPGPGRTPGPDGLWIYPAVLPDGKRLPVLRILQQGGCDQGCAYCPLRHGGGGDVSFGSEELASAFAALRQRGRVQGLFLSSAIRGTPAATMDRMLATAEIIRQRQRFTGYLHLKIIPGARPDQVEAALGLASRVSVNLEAPSDEHLRRIAPGKHLAELLGPLAQARRLIRAAGSRQSMTTQFVVGAGGETDREYADLAERLYGELDLARVYYSAFQPAPGTPLGGRTPTPLLREHRLYQMDFLLRAYGFRAGELPFDERGDLPRDADPKTAWARLHPERFPVEVNRAPLEELLRVPGIGPRSARRLVALRRRGHVRDVAALRAAGATTAHAAPWVLLDGRRVPQQLALPLG